MDKKIQDTRNSDYTNSIAKKTDGLVEKAT